MQNTAADVLTLYENSRKHTHALHDITVAWDFARSLFGVVLKKHEVLPDDYWEQCAAARKLLSDIGENVSHLKSLIPVAPGQEGNINTSV